ncbi:multicopper oxidase family protein [Dermatophilaceae bacterium Sec6.4]
MSSEVSRRRALAIVGFGAVGTIVGGVGTGRAFWPSGTFSAPTGQGMREPASLASSSGVLAVTLRAARGVTLMGRHTQALGYNGSSPGPTLRVQPGDVLRVTLQNDLAGPTNLHTHGLHVSPEGTSDNIFRSIAPGSSAGYEFHIPPDHPLGTFWYHPHLHGSVADQVFGGLFGALLVTGAHEPSVTRDRVIVISDTTLTAGGQVAGVSNAQVMRGREGDLVLVNGQHQPRIDVTAGTLERWRVVNACTSRFLNLRLDGHTWGMLGYDGQGLHAPSDEKSVLLAPGNRADLLLRPTVAGTFMLRTAGHDRGGMGMMMGGGSATSAETVLATVLIGVGTGSAATSWPSVAAGPLDLRSARVDQRRSLAFTMGMGMVFGFDGRPFDPARIDQQLSLGTLEEWTITNSTMMDHPFHLHVWPMQVTDAPDSDPNGPPDWRDVIIVPAGGRVTVRIPVRDYGGKTVYHCHILDHEDLGMMGQVQAR